jgi:non-specific serine/threonine protein kinase
LLDETERTLFRRLSVLAGGFTLEAAESVCAGGDIEEDDVLDLLSRLADKSLVSVAEHGGSEARYWLLETVRQFGWEKLEEAGEVAQTRKRHAEFYLALAEEAEPELSGAREGVWLEKLELEHDNLRAALEWSLECDDGAELGLRLSGALGGFWHVCGYLSEGRRWLDRELARRRSGVLPSPTRAKALSRAGWIAIFQGDG